MSLPPPRLLNPVSDLPFLPQLANIHAACIETDNQLATFLLPLSHVRMVNYWRDIVHQVEKHHAFVVLQFAEGQSEPDSETEVVGYVVLQMPVTETGPFRAEVVKLMVSPQHRRKGVARRVMGKLEQAAKERGRYYLTLDTTIGLPAEHVYPKLGWTEWGILPKHGISPFDGSLVDEKYFYKNLCEQK